MYKLYLKMRLNQLDKQIDRAYEYINSYVRYSEQGYWKGYVRELLDKRLKILNKLRDAK